MGALGGPHHAALSQQAGILPAGTLYFFLTGADLKQLLGVAVFFCGLALAARVAILFAGHNYNVAAEANSLFGVLEVADGRPLYVGKEVRPYLTYLYPPVYPYLNAAVLKALHLQDLRWRVLGVRTVGILCALLVFFALWRFRPGGTSYGWPLFLLMLLLSSSKMADYVSSCRNDCLSLLWEVLAFGLFARFIRGSERRHLLGFFLLTVLAFGTRQNSVSLISAGSLWLLLNRRYTQFLAVVVGWFALVGGLAYFAYVHTHGEILDHLILSNIRGFRPVNREFFDFSLLSFFAGLALFIPFCLLGLKEGWALKGEKGFLFLALLCSTALSGAVFLRAGGDVNYFFLPILLAGYFGLPVLQQWLQEQPAIARSLIATQLLLIAVIFGLKTRSAMNYADLDYEELADRVRATFPRYVLLMGNYSQNMGIHLRDWAYHGPDVTNASAVAMNGHAKLRWILSDLDRAIHSGKVSAILYVHPGCATYGRQPERWFESYPVVERWSDWICVYRKDGLGVKVAVDHAH